jgi:hypothetical protein
MERALDFPRWSRGVAEAIHGPVCQLSAKQIATTKKALRILDPGHFGYLALRLVGHGEAPAFHRSVLHQCACAKLGQREITRALHVGYSDRLGTWRPANTIALSFFVAPPAADRSVIQQCAGVVIARHQSTNPR